MNDSACTPNGKQCNYGTSPCVADGITCQNGQWLPDPPLEIPRVTCDLFGTSIPTDGQSCACLGTLACAFNDCSARGRVTATCDNTSWHVTTTPCSVDPCGPAGTSNGPVCAPREVCVVSEAIVPTYTCQPDPCQSQDLPTSCDCAAALCGGGVMQCGFGNQKVTCSCRIC